MHKNKEKNLAGIIHQISKPLCLFLIGLVFFEQFFIFLFYLITFKHMRQYDAVKLVQYTAEVMEGYKSIGWLTEYWQEHYDEMELIYDSTRLTARKDKLEEEFVEMSTFKDVTYEMIDTQPEDIQKLFAEVCYARLTRELDKLKYHFGPSYLYAFDVDEESGDGIFLLTGAYNNESRISEGGELYELGYVMPYSEGTYPQLDYLLETGNSSFQLDSIWNKRLLEGDVYVHMFSPVYSPEGELVMIIGASYEWLDLFAASIDMYVIMVAASAIVLVLILLRTKKLLIKNVVDPVTKEQQVLQVYSQDKDPGKAIAGLDEIKTNNEIESLAGNFSSMIAELDRYMDEIRQMTEEKERIAAELSLAEKIQRGMLPADFPPFPRYTEFDLFASMDPAKETGGDFYDFFLMDDDHIALVIADVSGKGMPAALFMMNAMTLIRTRTRMDKGKPGEILTDVNNLLCERNEQNMFVTVWMAILQISTGCGIAANAGHEDPVIKRTGGDYEAVLYDHDMVMGALDGITYTDHEFELNPGDTLYVYTDGVPEAINEADEFYGMDRLIECLNANASLSVVELLPVVRKDIETFAGNTPQFDDITMLGFKYNGRKD